ncbi:MAG: phage tail protein, partial [Clostridiales bacterium]|nr:phage tail protein [Clostridiales bacterium]
MADNFGLKIGVEGEKEFKNALRDINQSFKVLGSEMKLVSSEFDKQDKSVAAVAAKNEVLNKAIDAQKDKIKTLEDALRNASESFGENDKRTQNWQIALNNANAELNGMERELEDNEKALDDMGKEEDDAAKSADELGDELKDTGEEAEKSGGKFEKLGGVLKGIGAAMGAVAVAAGAAAIKLGKEVIAAYADYEQLVGGVDTLFGDASQTVQGYASNAFKTAG